MLGALAGVEDDDVDLAAQGFNYDTIQGKGIREAGNEFGHGRRGKRSSPLQMRPSGVLAGVRGTPRVPTELRSKEIRFKRKWNEGELRKKMTWLDGLCTEEKCVR